MAYETFPDISGTVEFAQYPLTQSQIHKAISTPFESGHVNVRPRWSNFRRTWNWSCKVLLPLDADKVMGFFRDIQGGGNPFYITNRINKVWTPALEPTVADLPGGSLGSRTYYLVYTWSDGTKETLPTPEATLSLAANEYASLSIKALPPGADRANIYIGTSPSVWKYSARITSHFGQWVEDDSSTTVNADSSSGTYILFVASTTGFQVGSLIDVNPGGPRQEYHVIDAILSGPARIQTESMLTYTHTLADADVVATDVGNGVVAPTENDFTGETILVRLLDEPNLALEATGVYSLEFNLEEVLQ